VLRGPAAKGVALRLGLLGLATYLSISTFLGWWILTCRPDFGACTFFLLGLVFLLRFEHDRPCTAGIAAGLCFFLAWSINWTAHL